MPQLNAYEITCVASTPAEYIISQGGSFIQQFSTLAAAMAWLAGVLVYGDVIQYLSEPVTTSYS